MLFKIRQELGFSRIEWEQLDWISQRAYIRGMARKEWRAAYSNWEQLEPKKRGRPPIKPNFDENISDSQTDPNQLKDIEFGSEGLDIQDVELG